MQQNTRDRYPAESITKFIAKIRKAEPHGGDFQALLNQEKHRALKRANDAAETLVAPVEVLEDALKKTVDVMIPPLEMLPVNLKERWPELTDEQFQFVKATVAECRNAMADAELGLDDDD